MSVSHTKGPWRLGRKNLLSIEPEKMPRVFRIAKVNVCPWGTCAEEEAEANALLIAAAPMILESLQALLKALRAQDNPIIHGDVVSECNWWVAVATNESKKLS